MGLWVGGGSLIQVVLFPTLYKLAPEIKHKDNLLELFYKSSGFTYTLSMLAASDVLH